MLTSQIVAGIGRVHFPWGARSHVADLDQEVRDYFETGIELRPNDVVFDVGANIGMFALHALRAAGGPLRLYCFEPIPDLFAALKKNLGNSNHRLFNTGLTSADGPRRATFHYFKRLPCDSTQHIEEKRAEFREYFEAKGSTMSESVRALPLGGRALAPLVKYLVSRFSSNPLTRQFFDIGIGTTTVECALEPMQKVLDDEKVGCVDLLKVDVEGAELEVLEGIGEEGWPKIRQIVLEGHDEGGRLAKIEALLSKAGFTDVDVSRPNLATQRGLNNFVLAAKANR